MTILDDAVGMLERAGYQNKGRLVLVSGIRLDFDAVLEGPNNAKELVLILDGKELEQGAALKNLRTLSLLLERTESRRPVTLILARPSQGPAEIKKLGDLVRLLVLKEDETDLDLSLGPLLPLKLPNTVEPSRSASSALESELGSFGKDPLIRELVNAASKSSDQVHDKMIDEINRATVNRKTKPSRQ